MYSCVKVCLFTVINLYVSVFIMFIYLYIDFDNDATPPLMKNNSMIKINKEELEEFIQRLMYFFNHYNVLDLLLTNKLKDY